MANSINTNPGALVALAALRTSQANLNFASKQVQTGYRTADAMDNAGTFSVAQGVRGNLQAYKAVQMSLSNGIGLGEVTRAALERMTDVIGNMKAKITQLADGSINANQRAILLNDFNQISGAIPNYINQANYNGNNLLSSGSIARTFVSDVSAAQLTLSSQAAVSTAWTTFQGAVNVSTAALATGSITTIQTFSDAISNALGQVAAESRTLRSQLEFVNQLVDASSEGLGALVDADIGRAAAATQAEQVRQQIATTALSVANQQPSVMLGFMR